jgi:hypothetical protein
LTDSVDKLELAIKVKNVHYLNYYKLQFYWRGGVGVKARVDMDV